MCHTHFGQHGLYVHVIKFHIPFSSISAHTHTHTHTRTHTHMYSNMHTHTHTMTRFLVVKWRKEPTSSGRNGMQTLNSSSSSSTFDMSLRGCNSDHWRIYAITVYYFCLHFPTFVYKQYTSLIVQY